jgi:hypothetical protein
MKRYNTVHSIHKEIGKNGCIKRTSFYIRGKEVGDMITVLGCASQLVLRD